MNKRRTNQPFKNPKARLIFAVMVTSLLFLVNACQFLPDDVWEGEGGNHSNAPDSINFTKEALYPEGIRYDEINKRFLVSSLNLGVVGIVKDDGSYTPFIVDANLIQSAGIYIDYLKAHILVANTDVGIAVRSTPETLNTGGLGVYDLNTGVLVRYVNLTTLRPALPHLVNDVTSDFASNVYLTDAFANIIYKVDNKGNASVFFENPEVFPPSAPSIGFNGIVFHPDGYLIVGKSDVNKLYKIPVKNPSQYSEIATDQLEGPDGLLLKNKKDLVVVGNTPDPKVYKFTSKNNWLTASVNSIFNIGRPVSPTTATSRGKSTYVLYAYLTEFLTGQNPPVSQFTIKRVHFK